MRSDAGMCHHNNQSKTPCQSRNKAPWRRREQQRPRGGRAARTASPEAARKIPPCRGVNRNSLWRRATENRPCRRQGGAKSRNVEGIRSHFVSVLVLYPKSGPLSSMKTSAAPVGLNSGRRAAHERFRRSIRVPPRETFALCSHSVAKTILKRDRVTVLSDQRSNRSTV